MFNGMPHPTFPTGAGPSSVGPFNANIPSNEYMGPTNMPNMTLPQHFHMQSSPHQRPPGHLPSLPLSDQTSLPYQPQGYNSLCIFLLCVISKLILANVVTNNLKLKLYSL